MQDVSTRRYLSTAEYKVRSNREVIGFIKEEVISDEVMKMLCGENIFIVGL